jgi:hypothetical protein
MLHAFWWKILMCPVYTKYNWFLYQMLYYMCSLICGFSMHEIWLCLVCTESVRNTDRHRSLSLGGSGTKSRFESRRASSIVYERKFFYDLVQSICMTWMHALSSSDGTLIVGLCLGYIYGWINFLQNRYLCILWRYLSHLIV